MTMVKRTRVGEWWANVDRLDRYCDRLRHAQIECRDFRRLLPDCDRDGVVIYADPPYLPQTRTRSGSAYRHEMTAEDHDMLLDLLCRMRRAKVVISGYDSPLYNQRLRRWSRYEFKHIVNSSFSRDERPRRTEVIWVSPQRMR